MAGRSQEVWIVNQNAITPDLPGGTRHFDIAKELVARGYKVRIFASDVNLALRRHTRLSPGELFRSEVVDGVEFVWVWAETYSGNDWRRAANMLSFSRNFLRVARLLSRGAAPAVIIGSSPQPFAAYAAARAARRCGSRFVLELRDLWPQAIVDMGSVSAWHPGVGVMRLLERYLYARADHFIVLAKGSIGYLARRGIPEARITYLPNGVHLGHFQVRASRGEARKRYGFTEFTVVYTGAHGPANNLETLIDAAVELKGDGVEVALVGDGPAKAGLKAHAERCGAVNVRFLPPVPKREIPDLLTGADSGAITLKRADAFSYGISPNKLFDYMAAGLPVACNVPGEIGSLVAEARAGVTVEPEDPVALAEAIRKLKRATDGERAALGMSGRAFVEANFSRERLADLLVEILEAGRR